MQERYVILSLKTLLLPAAAAVVMQKRKSSPKHVVDERVEKETKMFAALQEDGTLSPLSAWTTEPAFGESVEFLVDEEDRFSLDKENVKLHYLLNEAELSYGSRQCHRGVGNPHGEESELLYYVEQPVIEKFQIQLNLKPDLEILW